MEGSTHLSKHPVDGIAIQFSQEQRDWMLLVSYLHLEQDKPEKAAVLLRLLLRVFPEDREVLQCLALAELLAGHPQQSARSAIKASKLATPELKLPIGLVFAKSLWEQGQHDAARDFIKTLLHDAPVGEA